jgi:hypothetical protein
MTLNLKIFYWLYNLSHHSAVFDRVVIFIAEKFDKILFVIALIFFITLFVLHRDWKNKGWVAWIYEAVIIGVSVVSAWVVSFIIKSITAIPRPFIALQDVSPLFIHGGYDSFPSGHATIFFVLCHYTSSGLSMAELVDCASAKSIEIMDVKLAHEDIEHMIKALLQSVALGMVPDTPWNGLARAHGGFIYVRQDGEVVCFHVYNSDEFKEYLYRNTKLETNSTKKHRFASVYRKKDKVYFDLNLAIRYTS